MMQAAPALDSPPAVGGDDAVGGAGRPSLRDAADPMGLARARGRRLAAASAAQSRGGFSRDRFHPRWGPFFPRDRGPAWAPPPRPLAPRRPPPPLPPAPSLAAAA